MLRAMLSFASALAAIMARGTLAQKSIITATRIYVFNPRSEAPTGGELSRSLPDIPTLQVRQGELMNLRILGHAGDVPHLGG